MLPAIQSFSRLLGSAPTWVAAGLPSLNRISVGIPRTANSFGDIGLLSMSTFDTVNLPANPPASSSSAGAIILHGPHHSAQKSTSTGPFLLASTTSVAKLLSVTATVFALMVKGPLVPVDGKGGTSGQPGQAASVAWPGSCESSLSSGRSITLASRVQIKAHKIAMPGKIACRTARE